MSIKIVTEKTITGRGFTLIELIVTIAIFAILLSGVLGSIAALSKATKAAREKTVLSSLAVNYLEIVRNMPYSQVGTINGNPNGGLPDLTNAYAENIGGITYKIYYRVRHIDDPADGTAGNGDNYPADYKQVIMDILNTNTGQITTFFTTVVPKGLEGTNDQGALSVQVIDSTGNPVVGANVEITYPTTSPAIILNDTTNSSGQILEVGLPLAVNDYRIVASKTGYSQDRTYPITAQNPNPTHPDATIASGTVTSATFSIDTLANLNIKTLDDVCQPLSNINVNISGAKLIGNNPNVVKFNNNYASLAGVIGLTGLEWDSYTPVLLSGQSVVIYGTSPIQKIDVLPGTTQTYTMILGPDGTPPNNNSLLVVVKDGSGSALENASVTLNFNGTPLQTLTTGGSVWTQSDWSGGGGQAQWSSSTPTRYFQDDGNIDNATLPTGLRLNQTAGNYAASGWAESSTFDTGTNATNYSILSWLPASQSTSTAVQFQIAANNDNATWNYVGPDGTSATYFTTPGTDMGSALDGNRYVRYKVFLSSSDPSKTPVLTSANINFVTGCFTPGQVIFTGLAAAANSYTLSVSLPGYQTQNNIPLNINGDQSFQVIMSQ